MFCKEDQFNINPADNKGSMNISDQHTLNGGYNN
jgi:hypothetical protein